MATINLKLMQGREYLRGTVYFELLPGPYRKKCWNDESVYLTEEAFAFLETIIFRHESSYDHYAFIDVPSETWRKIIHDLKLLREKLASANDFTALSVDLEDLSPRTIKSFTAEFAEHQRDLEIMLKELIGWLEKTLIAISTIAILGI
jgi:hypothetical protein